MRRIQSSELRASEVPPSPESTKVVREEAIEKYDDDFDVDCDLPCIKVRATPHSIVVLNQSIPSSLLDVGAVRIRLIPPS
jgi:hypothetical protein